MKGIGKRYRRVLVKPNVCGEPHRDIGGLLRLASAQLFLHKTIRIVGGYRLLEMKSSISLPPIELLVPL